MLVARILLHMKTKCAHKINSEPLKYEEQNNEN